MTISLETLANIHCLDTEELLSFVNSSSEDYKIKDLRIDTRSAITLIADFCIKGKHECGICGEIKGRSPKNPNLANGFRDATLQLFVCWQCHDHPKYIDLKLAKVPQ